MITFIIFVSFMCLIVGYVFVKVKFHSINYFIKGKIIKDETLSEIEKIHLKHIKHIYGIILTILPIIGFSWGLFGIIITLSIVSSSYIDYFVGNDLDFLLLVLNYWIIINIIILSVIPILFIIKRASIPIGMKKSFNKYFFLILIIVIFLGLYYSYRSFNLTPSGLIFLLLISIPSIFSSWYVGQFFAVLIIRSFYQTIGWDFVLNKKISLFGRIKGLISLILALLTPLLAINSILAVFFNNTNKGGFLGITLSYVINLHYDWSIDFILPSFSFLVNGLIVFLIVGPLVTFIFRPTNFFELSLNSKIYYTLSNFDWEFFNESSISTADSILIEALSLQEMIGVLILFLSFINYIAILSTGAIISSFQVHFSYFNKSIGLDIINGTIKLIEIPVLFFIGFLIFRDLSEERELINLASTSMKLSKIKLNVS